MVVLLSFTSLVFDLLDEDCFQIKKMHTTDNLKFFQIINCGLYKRIGLQTSYGGGNRDRNLQYIRFFRLTEEVSFFNFKGSIISAQFTTGLVQMGNSHRAVDANHCPPRPCTVTGISFVAP